MKEYTFESFKVNAGNRNAYKTMLKFCEKSEPYLIFLNGPTCSGKTHLLKAAQTVFGDNAAYITGNDFTDELVDTIRKGNSTADFKDKYKNIPCLLFDCFQFIHGRPSTMEEFLNILDYRIVNGLKTVLASDIPINEFENTDEHITAKIAKEFVNAKIGESTFMLGKDFFSEFKAKIAEKNDEACKTYQNSRKYTAFITKLIEEILNKNGYSYGTEFYRIDISGWKEIECDEIVASDRGYKLNNNLWDFDVAIEHENDDKDWTYEITKLLTVNCPLRVVIGYVPARLRGKDMVYLEKVFEQIKSLKVFSKNDFINDEFVVILGNSKCERIGDYFNYEAYRLSSEGFAPLIV